MTSSQGQCISRKAQRSATYKATRIWRKGAENETAFLAGDSPLNGDWLPLPRRKSPKMVYDRVCFFKEMQDWILKSERIRKWILRFFTRQINPRSLGSWCVKGTEESSLEVDSSVPLTHHDPKLRRSWIDLFSKETRGETPIRPGTFLYQDHPTKSDVTSG